MKFIATARGFIKEAFLYYDKESNEMKETIVYTSSLREAKQFKKKSANNCLQKFNLQGFIYSPFEQETIGEHCYDVKPDPYYNASYIDKMAYAPRKVWNRQFSDLEFLKGDKHPKDKYYTYEEAVALAKEKNLELIKQLNIYGNRKSNFIIEWKFSTWLRKNRRFIQYNSPNPNVQY